MIFSYPFMIRALVVGVLISICAALLGCSLVIKRFSMIGDGLSHVGFGALAIASAFNIYPLYVSIPVVIIAAIGLIRFNEKLGVKGDSAIAILSTGALAVGIMVISLSKGANIDLSSYLFGSILAVDNKDIVLSVLLCAVVLFLFIVFYNKIFMITFDEQFAKAAGVNVNGYNMLIAVLCSVTIVLGMRLMGALLISSLIIFPSICAMKIVKSYKSVVILSTVFSVFSFVVGIIVSFYAGTPAGATIVCVNILDFIICNIIKKFR